MWKYVTRKIPLYVMLPRKTKDAKKIIINLNNYRNWKFFLSNDVKKAYKENVREMISGLKFNSPIKLHFTLHQGTNRRVDRSNVLSIHEKFFCDALTECGCIGDDNDKYIESTSYSSGKILPKDPHVEVTIYYE